MHWRLQILQATCALLTAIGQDGSRNSFSLIFAIVESETKEVWMWFLHYLRRYVTPKPNLCIISDKGTGLLAALQSEHVRWNGPDVSSVYCIHHIVSNFNKQFKNVDLKNKSSIWVCFFLFHASYSCFITSSLYLLLIVLSFGIRYEMRKSRFEANLLAMQVEFPQATDWLDQIPKSKWT